MAATCALMMHCLMSKTFGGSDETESLFPPLLKTRRMTDARKRGMNIDISEPRFYFLRGAGRLMIGLHVAVLWPNMRGGFQRVLMTQESQDARSLLILASEVETSQKLLWLHGQNVFCLNTID